MFLSKYYSYIFFIIKIQFLPVFIKIQFFYFFIKIHLLPFFILRDGGGGCIRILCFLFIGKCYMYISQYISYQVRIKIQFLPVLLNTVLSSLYIKIQFFPVFIKIQFFLVLIKIHFLQDVCQNTIQLVL